MSSNELCWPWLGIRDASDRSICAPEGACGTRSLAFIGARYSSRLTFSDPCPHIRRNKLTCIWKNYLCLGWTIPQTFDLTSAAIEYLDSLGRFAVVLDVENQCLRSIMRSKWHQAAMSLLCCGTITRRWPPQDRWALIIAIWHSWPLQDTRLVRVWRSGIFRLIRFLGQDEM